MNVHSRDLTSSSNSSRNSEIFEEMVNNLKLKNLNGLHGLNLGKLGMSKLAECNVNNIP